jgi:hypothetical protein
VFLGAAELHVFCRSGDGASCAYFVRHDSVVLLHKSQKRFSQCLRTQVDIHQDK